MTPQVAKALTATVLLPLSNPRKKVPTLSSTSIRIKAVGAMPTGGGVTPITLGGKLTATRFPGDVLELLYPFLRAYWHTLSGEVVVQLNATNGGTPACHAFPVAAPSEESSRSMAPAVQAASAAVCAA